MVMRPSSGYANNLVQGAVAVNTEPDNMSILLDRVGYFCELFHINIHALK